MTTTIEEFEIKYARKPVQTENNGTDNAGYIDEKFQESLRKMPLFRIFMGYQLIPIKCSEWSLQKNCGDMSG